MSDNWFYEYFINEAKSIIRPCSGGGSVPKPLTYEYMPEGYPKKSVQTVTLMEEQEVAFAFDSKDDGYFAQPTEAPAIAEGQTYVVNWDGTEYECVGVGKGVYVLGNLSIAGMGDDTGEPFVYGYDPNEPIGQFVTLDTSASHTISVKTVTEVITSMTYDYMPEGYPRKSVQTVTLMEEQALAFAYENELYTASLTNAFEFVVGQTYTVNWDGTAYECVCSTFNSVPNIGNLSILNAGNDTGEPFFGVRGADRDDVVFYTLDTSASHTISIKRIEKTLTPMAKEFLPNIPAGANSTTVFYI